MADENKTTEEKFSEVVTEVKDQVSKLGDNYKASHEEMLRNYEELKHTIDESEKSKDVLITEKMDKLTADISTRQEEADNKAAEREAKLNERIDGIEVALQRPGAGNSEASKEELKEARDFMIHKLSRAGSISTGIKHQVSREMQPDMEEYNSYKIAMEDYLRTYDDNKFNTRYPESAKTLIVGSDPDGGYLVLPAMASDVIKREFEVDPMRQLARIETISTDRIEWLVDQDDANAEWEEETISTSDDTTPKWNKKSISVHPLATRPKISQQMIEDSSINIENWLSDKVGDRFGRTEGATFITGSGTGRPRGILTYADGTSWGQIEQVAMGHATNLTADGFVDIKYSMIEQYLERGTWLMNRTTVRDAMKLKDGMGGYIWKPSMIAGDPGSSILNLPVRMSTTMPAVAANALAVVLADFKEAYVIVDRIGISVLRNPYSHSPLIEYYFRKRVGGDVVKYDSIKIGVIST